MTDIVEIVTDLCNNYPIFLDGKAQCLRSEETSIFMYYKGREFHYDMELGILQILYCGTIASILAPNSNEKDSEDKE